MEIARMAYINDGQGKSCDGAWKSSRRCVGSWKVCISAREKCWCRI